MVLFSANPFSYGGLTAAGLLRPQLHDLSCKPVSIREIDPRLSRTTPTVVLTAARRDGSQLRAPNHRAAPSLDDTTLLAMRPPSALCHGVAETPRHARHLPMRAAAMKLFGLYLAITYAVYFGFL